VPVIIKYNLISIYHMDTPSGFIGLLNLKMKLGEKCGRECGRVMPDS
jgi:hypothetical protein